MIENKLLSPNERKAKFIAELPSDYEYKFCFDGDQLRIVGINKDKKLLIFALDKNDKLICITE